MNQVKCSRGGFGLCGFLTDPSVSQSMGEKGAEANQNQADQHGGYRFNQRNQHACHTDECAKHHAGNRRETPVPVGGEL
ncbi:Uncharacterised protein [Vibrio cholerae]|nr:Uncharacterised protein [Vibrio cholerae]CSA34143.1 Uncharacterised protein [Vibrio cholerae]CSB12247.1 Uncharacterised protein [Vibrio cholerae]CSC09779.1 Uncharacterised protein [Vibrio cholerae]CSC67914.1 Uncharacterised protein [Vibrio cholerae]